ncbi:probable serine/threonine-protein kinase At1g54610 [Vigna radiata var. radiata]|uniref:Probable serine/threonine-protein kinase At1g54610 n=1 Tax=Vigna radiata var. radiata TaxID=3916 RepID=A0A1S3T826_VIGRR|nr:probable serine/threonine-protein kinase At1g54610 [Vigna radiata var. radiata]
MGCVCGRFSPPSEAQRRNHQVKRVLSRKGSRPRSSNVGERVKRDTQRQRVRVSVNKDSAGDAVRGEKEKPVPKEEKNKVREDAAKESKSSKDLDSNESKNEFVDGWPKWLLDNIPTNVLAKLVPKSADSYEKLAKIGRGTYSNVYKAREKGTGKIVALKKVRFDTSDSESIKFMAREIMMLQMLDHPNVIKLKGLATSRMQYSLYLVFDFMQSDLTRIISRPGQTLTEPQIKCYMQQLLSGLQHCHERGIMHRDIKASNLLIDRKGVLKIADFGLATSIESGKPLTNRVVTLWYRAPELLLGSTDYGYSIDLWSAGCLLAEMFLGRPIMPGRTEVEQIQMIFKLCGSPSEDYFKKLKLTTSFRPPQHYKPTYQDNFNKFPSSFHSLLATLLDLNPTNRGTAASALQTEFFRCSPLACDPSALPVIIKDEDERLQTKRSKRHRVSKKGQPSQTSKSEAESRKTQSPEQPRQDTQSTKEKNVEQQKQSQETGSGSSTSSGSRLFTNEGSTNTSLSPTFLSSGSVRKSPKTEGSPNALKNINHYNALLQASMIDIINRNEDSEVPQLPKSFSHLDYRLGPDKLSNLYTLSNKYV